MEDNALAKGIRRIIGVTGDEAFKAQRDADEYEVKVQDLKKLEGSALESSMKPLGKVKLGLINRNWKPQYSLLSVKVKSANCLTKLKRSLTRAKRHVKLKKAKRYLKLI